ncbi:alpha/beta fold hydrolase [Paraferrimonas haliotis]|uniref:alpha/beta fold hydrolase n=1 Tax=Paraferrimonas haliotis TaxID=2013866 RepID=UPI000BA8E303|nr:alpha/beta hydrolase [Paraferrimonas haliotis]
MTRFLLTLCLMITLSGCSSVQRVEDMQARQWQQLGFTEQQLALPNHQGQLHYFVGEHSDKPALLLIHGIGGTAINTWSEVIPRINEHFYVIAVDLLWFGDSFSNQEATLPAQTQAMSALLDHLNITEVAVVGLSYGGFVTLDMMIHEPRVNKAIMISSPGLSLSDKEIAALNQRFNQASSSDIFVPKDHHGVRLLLDNSFADFPWYPSFIDEQINQLYFAPNPSQKRALIDSLPSYRDQLLEQNVTQNLPPSLLLWGAKDKIFPLHLGMEFARLLSSPIVIVADGSHVLSSDAPDVVGDVINEFLAND